MATSPSRTIKRSAGLTKSLAEFFGMENENPLFQVNPHSFFLAKYPLLSMPIIAWIAVLSKFRFS